jgi:16S rRNA (cytosine967-C5)-methyltransferase
MTQNISPSRTYALQVLHSVLTEGKLLDECLEAEAPESIHENDRALAREIISGTCRHLEKVRYSLKKFANRFDNFPPMMQRILELTAYQILYLNKVPGFAAVSEAVNMVKKNKMSGLANAANGILRNLIRQKDTITYPKKHEDFEDYVSVKYSHPRWMIKQWQSIWNDDDIEAFCRFNNTRAPLSLRIRGDWNEAEKWFERHKIEWVKHEVLPDIAVIKTKSTESSLYQNPLWLVQDPVMTLPAAVLNPQPGWKIWDVCAAPGGKTFHLADQLHGKGTIIASDRSATRLQKLQEQMNFLGYTNIQPLVLNSLYDTLPQEINGLDAILLDVPCSGWGTFRRNPDLRWRLQPGDSKLSGDTALELLKKTTGVLKPGGIVVYSTCTLSPDENETVIERFLSQNQSFQLMALHSYIPKEWQSCIHKQGCFTGFPPITNTDGAFCARLQKQT